MIRHRTVQTRTDGESPQVFATPGVLTIDALASAPYDISPQRQLKTLVYVADGELVRIGVSRRGLVDRSVEWKLRTERSGERVPVDEVAGRARMLLSTE